jgi:uncharacterized protein YdaT
MPDWTAESFKRKHFKKASSSQAKSAARQANAMVRRGVDEGVAIATAIKRAHAMKRYNK